MKKTTFQIKFSHIYFIVLSMLFEPALSETLPIQQSEGMKFKVEKIADGLGVPWGMAFLNPSEIIFTEKEGGIGILSLKDNTTSKIEGGPAVKASGQGGLLDVAVPPDYTSNGWIYFTYSKDHNGRGVTVIARAHRKGSRLIDWEDILVTQSASGTSRHYGSRIAFDGKGHLFFTIGDRGVRASSQDLSTHSGSVLRIYLDGSTPKDNPFAGRQEARPEIWSYGHRNPQGISYDVLNQRLWISEHGPRGGDEVNLILPGRNYGWPVISYGKEYFAPIHVGEGTEKEGMEQAHKVYIPSIAPGSLILYSGKAFPKWKGNLMIGGLQIKHLNRLVLDNEGQVVAEERLLEHLNERFRALVESPQGWIYFSTSSGNIFVIKPV